MGCCQTKSAIPDRDLCECGHDHCFHGAPTYECQYKTPRFVKMTVKTPKEVVDYYTEETSFAAKTVEYQTSYVTIPSGYNYNTSVLQSASSYRNDPITKKKPVYKTVYEEQEKREQVGGCGCSLCRCFNCEALLDSHFQNAQISAKQSTNNLGENDNILLYAYFMQATKGQNNTNQFLSGFSDLNNKKWIAWKQLGKMTVHSAKKNILTK